jgi:hypothetical protein
MGLNPLSPRVEAPWVFATLAVGALLGGLLVGFEPVGGDPDRMYRPLKAELARALREGRLPFWSDRLGVGVPLVAESHVAAFYPANLVLYRLFGVSAAYRGSMWLHYLALVAATYAYARRLGLTAWGSCLTAVSFALCGFQMIHATHEPFYLLLPYLPLALLLTEAYVASGRPVWLATLALAMGAQWTLGHFQIQMWTNGLVLLTGLWRVIADRRPWRRGAGLAAALAWGGAVAAVQLALSWDLARSVGHMGRSLQDMAFFSFPPAHWIEPALPWFFRGLRHGPEDPYFMGLHTTGFEAVFYVGTVPLVLAFVGALDRGRGRATWVWRLIIPLSLALATMPAWWLGGYAAVLQLPGLGYFRAPARYTLLASLGLALLAGQGLDREVSGRRFKAGVALAVAFGLAAFGYGFVLAGRREFGSEPGLGGLPFGVASSLLSWAVALIALAAWRAGRAGAWLPALVTAVELGALYFLGPTQWGWAVTLPDRSPVLSAIKADPNVGRVGGVIDSLPVSAGMSTGTPYLGMTLSPINQLLRSTQERSVPHDAAVSLWQRRLGVTHSVWDEPIAVVPGETEDPPRRDPALDLLGYRPVGRPARRLWRVVHHPDPFPEARVALRARVAPDRRTMIGILSTYEGRDEAWFYPDDLPPRGASPPARSARVVAWDGRAGVVEHDGACLLVLTRAYDRGWRARVGDGPEAPVLRVDGGLQAIRIEGAGRTRVSVRFEPPALLASAAVSAVAASAALAIVVVSLARGFDESSRS